MWSFLQQQLQYQQHQQHILQQQAQQQQIVMNEIVQKQMQLTTTTTTTTTMTATGMTPPQQPPPPRRNPIPLHIALQHELEARKDPAFTAAAMNYISSAEGSQMMAALSAGGCQNYILEDDVGAAGEQDGELLDDDEEEEGRVLACPTSPDEPPGVLPPEGEEEEEPPAQPLPYEMPPPHPHKPPLNGLAESLQLGQGDHSLNDMSFTDCEDVAIELSEAGDGHRRHQQNISAAASEHAAQHSKYQRHLAGLKLLVCQTLTINLNLYDLVILKML